MKYKPIQPDDQSVYFAEDPKPEDLKDPFHGRFGWILRFLVSAFFGGFISLFIFIVIFRWYVIIPFWDTKFVHVLWIIPLVWGILGIFLFDKMMDITRNSFS